MEGSGGLAVPEGTAQLWLVRHGETEWNAARRLQGHTNEECPLNDRGRRQAEAVASALGDWHRLLGQGGFRKLYCSDLARARSTADAIGAATGLTPDPAFSQGLRERCMGAHLEGLHIHEAPEAAPDAWRAFREGRPIPGGGESSREMRRRVMTTAAQIAATHPGERVIAGAARTHASRRSSGGRSTPGSPCNPHARRSATSVLSLDLHASR
ncbi:unnamed protein product [Pedinophyceae sp. YPF-701]|nr:unnamed protein product [Pedinophyceae sp. YPF-701]